MNTRTIGKARLTTLALAAALALGATPAQTATISYNGIGTVWDLASHWDGGVLPGTADDALLGSYATRVRSGISSVHSFTGTGSLDLTGGVLSFAAASSIGSLNLTGGSLSGAGSVTASGLSRWTAGSMSGTGSTVFNGGLAIYGTTDKSLFGRRLELAGASTWDGGNLFFHDGAVLSNSGSFEDKNASAASLNIVGSGNSFINSGSGSYIKTGTGTTTLNAALVNDGTLAVNKGTLNLLGEVSGSGSFSAASGATLAFEAESNIDKLNWATGNLTGAGTLTVSQAASWTGGTLSGSGVSNYNGGLDIGGNGVKVIDQRILHMSNPSRWIDNSSVTLLNGAVMVNYSTFDDQNSGTASINSNHAGSYFSNVGSYVKSGAGTSNFGASFLNNGPLAVNAGTLNVYDEFSGSGDVAVASGATLGLWAASSMGRLTLAGGTLAAAHDVSVSGDSTWTSGTLKGAGSISFNDRLALSGNGGKQLEQLSLIMRGASTWSDDGALTLSNRATLSNMGSFDDQNKGTASILNGNFSGSFNNNAGASYTKSGVGTTLINTPFINDGMLTVKKGQLNLAGGLSGSGSVAVSGGALNLGANASLGSLTMSLGSLNASGDLTASGPSAWTGGSMSGTGTTSFNAGLAIGSGAGKVLDGRQLVLAGASSWTGNSALIFSNGATLVNKGSFTDDSPILAVLYSGSGKGFSNEIGASYIKNGAGDTVIEVPFTNNGTLTVNAGSLILEAGAGGSGSYSAASAATLAFNAPTNIARLDWGGGTLSGSGAVTVTKLSNWTGGTLSGMGPAMVSTSFNGGLNLSGAQGRFIDYRSVTLNGTTTWSDGGGSLSFKTGALLINNGNFIDQTNGFAEFVSADTSGGFVNNVGASYTKTSNTTTIIRTSFTNDGSVAVNAGVLRLLGSVSGSGSFSAARGATLALESTANIDTLDWSAGRLLGYGTLTVAKASTWSNGSIEGGGRKVFLSGLEIGGGPIKAVGDGTLTLGSGALTLDGASSWKGNGILQLTGDAFLSINGSFTDQNTGAALLDANWATSLYINGGASYTKSGAGTTTVNASTTNNGALTVSAGSLDFRYGLTNYSAGQLSGGSYTVSGTGALKLSSTAITANAAAITLDGPDAKFLNSSGDALSLLKTNQQGGSLALLNGASFTSAGGFVNAGVLSIGAGSGFSVTTLALDNRATGVLQMQGGTFYSGVSSTGLVSGYGTLMGFVNGSGTVRASGGTLLAMSGIYGTNTPVAIDTGAALSLGANSTVKRLDQSGTLNLGSHNLSVALDYNNAGFGLSNAFNRRAGVTGTGQILALGSVQQMLWGPNIHFGSTANAELVLPALRVSSTPFATAFTVNNVASLGTGVTLRGAVLTGGISSAAIGSSQLTARNWVAAAGTSSYAYTLSYSAATASQALTGQTLAIVNNFDNVAGQTLSITGGKVYAPAVAQLSSSTLNFGIVHVGDTISARSIAVGNAAPVAALNDVLLATASAGGAFNASGAISVAADGGDEIKVGLNTTQAGVFNGTATLAFASHNADMSDLALGSQQVALNAQVNHYAELVLAQAGGDGSFLGTGAAYTLNFGTLTQGAAGVAAILKVGNGAPDVADLLSLRFDLGTAESHFSLGGFDAIDGIGAGAVRSLQIGFSGLLVGQFDEVLTLHAIGSNASGYAGALADVQLHLVGEVAAVPEPASWAQFGLGLAGMVGFMARRRIGRRESAHARH